RSLAPRAVAELRLVRRIYARGHSDHNRAVRGSVVPASAVHRSRAQPVLSLIAPYSPHRPRSAYICLTSSCSRFGSVRVEHPYGHSNAPFATLPRNSRAITGRTFSACVLTRRDRGHCRRTPRLSKWTSSLWTSSPVVVSSP